MIFEQLDENGDGVIDMSEWSKLKDTDMFKDGMKVKVNVNGKEWEGKVGFFP